MWSGTVFVAFLYTLTNDSNSKVGYVEAMQGASQLASALPVGYLADKYSRSGVIKVGAILMACAIALTTYSVVQSESLDSGEGYDLLCGALVLWGVCGGIVNGPAQALFADSLPTGTRSRQLQPCSRQKDCKQKKNQEPCVAVQSQQLPQTTS